MRPWAEEMKRLSLKREALIERLSGDDVDERARLELLSYAQIVCLVNGTQPTLPIGETK